MFTDIQFVENSIVLNKAVVFGLETIQIKV
jgi:hypothetical protein